MSDITEGNSRVTLQIHNAHCDCSQNMLYFFNQHIIRAKHLSPCEMYPLDMTPFPLSLELSDFDPDTLN